MFGGVNSHDDALMKDNEESQPSSGDNAGQNEGDRPAAEGPATDGGAQAGRPSDPDNPFLGGFESETEGGTRGEYRRAPRLTRRRHDKVIGGVAGGIADYFGIDPLLVRLAFAGFALIGGGGIVLYVLGWIFIPERGEGEASAVAPKFDAMKYLGIGLIVIATLIFVDGIGFGSDGLGLFEHFFFALILVGLGLFLLRREPQAQTSPPSPPPVEPGQQTTAQTVAPQQTARAPAPPTTTYPATPVGYEPAGAGKSRSRSSLGLFTLAAILLITGAAAFLNNLGVTSFDGGQLSALALILLGGGLIVGAWWGRARWLIWIGVLIFPFVAFANLIDLSMVSRNGEVGTYFASPQTQTDIGDGYEILAGDATIDLADFEFTPDEQVELEVDIAFGQLFVMVPRDAYVEIDGSIQGGEIQFFNSRRGGQGVELVDSDGDPNSAAKVSLQLDGALGRIEVQRSSSRASIEGVPSDQETDQSRTQRQRPEQRERERP
jgi:phage shock protein PspC (stress-responsive transcriptional regulator)